METAVESQLKVPYAVVGKHKCGFCSGGAHGYCPGATKNGAGAPFKVIICACTAPDCGSSKMRCLDCNTRVLDYIDSEYWRCIDRAECTLRQQHNLDNDPLVQQIRSIKENVMAEKQNDTTPAAPKEPKVGTCLVTGKPTKGGKFAPGQDAKYVSLKVASVIEGKSTEDKVIKEMQGHGLSDALQGKFRKSLGLAVARKAAEKAKADEKAAEAKAAKAEKASA